VSLADAQAAIVAALEPLESEIADLAVYNGRNPNPTPPMIDVYPATPSQLPAGMGAGNSRAFFTVRARVTTSDPDTQLLLLRMLDPGDAANVERALADADAAAIGNDGEIGGFIDYPDGFVGCEWRVEAFL
jgi:hypothetical protein